jgi:4-amino-4-deoxy-L-arabinose transferase-like glycosyltransferase
MLSLLLAFVALKKNNKFWGLAGVLLGLTILTRANGFVLIFVIGLPWFQKNPLNKRTKSFLVLIGSIIIVLLLWVLLASYLESPLWPTKSYTSIAQTYYSPTEDRRSEEGRIFAEQQVANMIQIFTNNPVHVIKIYIEGMRNFYSLLLRTNNLVVFPLGILAILGALLYFGSKRNRLFLFLVLITIVHTIFINFRPYEGRYFLYLIPVIGACAGFAIETIVANIQKRVMIILASLFLIIFMISGFIKSLQYSIDVHHANDIELGDIIPNIQTLVDNDCTIIARKPHLPYYGNCNYLYFPNVEDFESLKKEISHREINHSTYLYYGSAENHFRPQFNQLMNPETSPAWLIPVSQSELPSSWVLYEVKKSP